MEIEKCGNITLINGDCMEFMQTQKDKAIDLAIVDPPYGIHRSGQQETFTKKAQHKRKYFKIEDGMIKHQEKIILIIYFVYQKTKSFSEQIILFNI